MAIESISGALSALTGGTAAASATTTTGSSFADMLTQALEDVQETEAQDQAGTLSLLSGEDEGIHTTLIESQKAELALNLAIQVRNKVIDAYNEVMRMQL